MARSNSVLKEFVAAKGQFFELKNGDEAQVKYIRAETITTNYRGQAIDCIRYHLEHCGKVMFWDRASRELAKQMSEIPENTEISIKRDGERAATKYIIERV